MKNFSNLFWPLVIFSLLTVIFFWQVFLKGQIPFPGDLLVGHYEPYKSNFYFGWGPGAVPHKAQGPDVIRELYPWKFFAIESIKNGALPWWNPYNFAGNPQLANFQTAAFYPLNLLFLLFSFNLAWTIFIFLQPVLAGFFTYLFTKELGLKRIAAIFSGAVFAFSSFLTVWIEYGNIGHAILWLPLALYLTEKLIKNFEWKKAALLILTITFSILAGFIQVTIYLYGAVFFYFLYRFFQIDTNFAAVILGRPKLRPTPESDSGQARMTESAKLVTGKKKTSHLLIFLIALVAPILLSVFQLLPTLELFQLSARGAYPQNELFRLLNPIYYPITTFVPDFFGHPATRNLWFWGTYIERVSYIGVIPLLFLFLSFFGKRERPFWFFATLAGIAYLFSLNVLPTQFILGLNPPIISTTVPTRILSLFCFSGAILAGMGMSSWLEEKKIKSALKIVAIFISLYLLVWLFVLLAPKFNSAEWTRHLSVSKRNLVLPTVFTFLGSGLVFVGGWAGKKKKIVALILLVLTVADLFYFFHKITPFSPKEFVYPKTPVTSFLKEKAGIDRFWGYGIASIGTNFATQEKVFSTDGSDALHIKRYGELISASKDGKVSSPVPRRDADITPGYGQDDLKNNFFRQKVLNLLGVKYILNKNDGLGSERQPDYQTFPKEKYELVWQEGKWQIYENKEVLSRIFLTANYVVEKDSKKIIQKIFDKNFDLKTVVLEENLPENIKLAGKGEVRLESYAPNRIELTIATSGPQLLFISDNYYPGWRTLVDRVETEIYRAHYSFRAIVVPQGEHQVVFVYQPNFWWWK